LIFLSKVLEIFYFLYFINSYFDPHLRAELILEL